MAKVSFAVVVSPEAAERIRDAAFWTNGETVGSLVERGTLELIARLEAERGKPFAPREGRVKTGRPKKA